MGTVVLVDGLTSCHPRTNHLRAAHGKTEGNQIQSLNHDDGLCTTTPTLLLPHAWPWAEQVQTVLGEAESAPRAENEGRDGREHKEEEDGAKSTERKSSADE